MGVPSDAFDSQLAVTRVIRALVPSLQLVLTSGDTTGDAEFRSDAKDRLVLEDYRQRMDWIKNVAGKFDYLMQSKWEIMRGYLEDIKDWGDIPDK